jgi:hypothetical protein
MSVLDGGPLSRQGGARGRITDSDGWQSTISGHSLVLAGSGSWRGCIRELAVEAMEHIPSEAIFRLIGINKDNNIGNCLTEFTGTCGVRKVEGPQAFTDRFVTGN